MERGESHKGLARTGNIGLRSTKSGLLISEARRPGFTKVQRGGTRGETSARARWVTSTPYFWGELG